MGRKKDVYKRQDKLITRKEAASILGISVKTLDAARTDGFLVKVNHDHFEIFRAIRTDFRIRDQYRSNSRTSERVFRN